MYPHINLITPSKGTPAHPTIRLKGSSIPLHDVDLLFPIYWVAVKELKLSYYIGEAPLFTIYTHYGNLI